MASWQARLTRAGFRLGRLTRPHADELDVEEARTWLDSSLARVSPRIVAQAEGVLAGGVPAEWVVPQGARAGRVLLYLHGGAYCSGSLDAYRGLVASLAEAARSRTLVVDYRLAPEHPFPAAFEDTCTAYAWLLAEGFAPGQVAIAGDSAGGGLALALMVSLREAGQPLPSAAVCISPWADLAFSGTSWTTNARRELVLHAPTLRQMASAYLGGLDPRTPLASPLYADLAGLPPLLIQVGGDECLLSDAQGVAERARAAGVDVELEVWEGMYHVWHVMARYVPESRQAIERIGAWLEPRLAEAA
jgi:monoterpene epsilon-lactone hydrolase